MRYLSFQFIIYISIDQLPIYIINFIGFVRMLQQSKLSKVLQRSLLKSILPYLNLNRDWIKWISYIGKTNYISFGNLGKQKKGKCMVCNKLFDNYFILILHLQIIHQNEIEVNSYEMADEIMIINFNQVVKMAEKNHFKDKYFTNNNQSCTMLYSLKIRMNQILTNVFDKFQRKKEKVKRQYFHPIDIFKQIGSDSDEEYVQDLGHIERELQKMKIGDFSDVNQNDKSFFITWNQEIYKVKKNQIYITEDVLRQALLNFAVTAKRMNIKRLNLVIHGWTLWSTGKVNSDDVSNFLRAFDKA